MAGGLGFEPRLAESESAVLPLDDPPAGLTLGVLRAATGFAAADLLAFHLARIARHEAGPAQRLAQRLIVADQRARNSVPDRAGLAGDAATAHMHADVELGGQLHHFQRLAHDHAAGLTTKEFVDRALVDGDTAGTGLHVDARRGALAPAGAVIRGRCHDLIFLSDFERFRLLRGMRML